MHIPRAALLSLSALTLLAGCDTRPPPASPDTTPNKDISGVERDVDGMKTRIELDQANKRIEELERDVAYLKTTPTTIDLKLLTDRVQALEVKLAGRNDTPADATPAHPALPASPKQDRPPHAARSILVLPDLEHR